MQRASDADRQATIDRLREAYGEGRLDLNEFEDRVARVAGSKTMGELVPLTADVPAPYEPPTQINPAKIVAPIMAVPPVITTVIYLLTTPGGYFWPMWVWFGCAIPVLVVLAVFMAVRNSR